MSFSEFIASRRTEATRKNYQWGVKYVVGDPDKFLKLAMDDRKRAESQIINTIIKERDRVASSTIRGPVSGVKSFLDYCEASLNWKKINSTLPAPKKVANDEAPSVEEIRALLSVAELRERVVTLVLASSGMRVGGFEDMKFKHLEVMRSGVGRITVYRGDPAEYNAFISPEAVQAVKAYETSRKDQAEENITPESFLIRDKWQFENRRTRLDPSIAKAVSTKSIQNTINQLWVKAGVRTFISRQNGNGYARQAFQNVHGFRKFFETQALRSGIGMEYVECFKGDKTHYHRPRDILLEKYLKAMPYLTISESHQLRYEVREENQLLKDRLLELEKEVHMWKYTIGKMIHPEKNGPGITLKET